MSAGRGGGGGGGGGGRTIAHAYDLVDALLATDGRLYCHIKHLPGNQFLHLLGQRTPPVLELVAVHDHRQRIDALALPPNPLDEILARLTASGVPAVELSGRHDVAQRRTAAGGVSASSL